MPTVWTRVRQFLLLTSVLSALSILACAPQSRNSSGMTSTGSAALIPTGAPDPSTGRETTNGGIDGGGGNGIDRKMLETFREYPMKDPVFVERLWPIIQVMQKKLPRFGNSLSYMAQVQPWYFVPESPHKKVLPEVLGVGFDTEQYAYQSENEIFVDSRVSKKMREEDLNSKTRGEDVSALADLYAHEMVMAVYLLPFSSIQKNCTVENYGQSDSLIGDCSADSKVQSRRARRPLTKDDYQNVRYVTKLLQTTASGLTDRQLALDLKLHNFPQYDSGEHLYKEPQVMTLEEFSQVLLTEHAANRLPKYTGLNAINRDPKAECRYAIQYLKDKNSLQLQRWFTGLGNQDRIGQPETFWFTHGGGQDGAIQVSFTGSDINLKKAVSLYAGPINPTLGDKRTQIDITLSEHNVITRIHIQHEVYGRNLNSETPGWTAITSEQKPNSSFIDCVSEEQMMY